VPTAYVEPGRLEKESVTVEPTATGAILRSRRTAAGFKQNAFAALLRIPPQRLSEFETGHKPVPEDVWDEAVRVLDEARPSPRAGTGGPRQEGFHAHPLAVVRHAHGWTKADLARRLAAAVGSSDAGKVRRWERGVVPDMPTQYALADLLRVPRQQVAVRPWPGWLPGPGGADVELPWNAEGTLAALDATVGAAAVDRRAFLTLSTAAVSGVAQRWAALPTSAVEEAFGGGSADDLVRGFEERLPWLRTRQDELGGGALELLDAELRTAAVMMRHRLGSSSSRRMANVAAELARLAGWAGVDLGRASAAERYFVTGLRAAYHAGDRIAGANIMKSWGLLLVESGRPHDAQVLMAAAHQATVTAPPRVRAMLRVREARVEASLGNGPVCGTLLAESSRLLEQGVGRDDHPPAVGYFGPAELAAQSAACHRLLGRPDKVQAALAGALVVDLPSRKVDRTTYQLWRGEAALAQGEVEHACALLADALPGLSAARSVRNTSRFSAVRRQLNRSHPTEPAVRALDEQASVLIT
jgi:transcriptional regulator with XRE-family HTH domain